MTPANPSVPKGLAQQFIATGTFSDSSTQDLTNQVTWASATTFVATINAAGRATAVNTGTSTISASLGGVTGSTVLTVVAPIASPPTFTKAFADSQLALFGPNNSTTLTFTLMNPSTTTTLNRTCVHRYPAIRTGRVDAQRFDRRMRRRNHYG